MYVFGRGTKMDRLKNDGRAQTLSLRLGSTSITAV